MNKDEALKMAIEALEQAEKQLTKYWDEDIKRGYYIEDMDESPILLCEDTINACKEALNIANCDLKQPEQEPEFDLKDLAGSAHEEAMSFGLDRNLFERYFKKIANLYTHPHQWQGLTDDEIKEFMGNCWESPYHLIKVIEQALKEKNHG